MSLVVGREGWENLASMEYLLDKHMHHTGHNLSLLGGDEYFFDLKCEKDFLRAYNECSPLKALISKRASAFNTGVLKLVHSETGKAAQGSEAKSLVRILRKPNVLQTGKQFFAQQNSYIDTFGYCPVLKMRPVGMVDELSAIWNLPPWLFDIKYTGAWLKQSKLSGIYSNYFIFWQGQKVEINFDDLFFIYDDGIGTEMDANLTIPDSRLVSLEYPVSNIVAAYKSRNTLITKRGAIGILSNTGQDVGGAIPLDETEKASLQKDFSKYGLIGQPFQIIITDAQLQWQQMGYATRDLMLFEEIDDDINRLCDAYQWPVELMSRTNGVTFDNKRQATKSAYRDAIIPQAESRDEQLTAGLVAEGSKIDIQRDFSKVEVLQEDKKAMADARKALNDALMVEYKNGLLTKNQWLAELGKEPNTDPSFDLYYDEKPVDENNDPSAAPKNTGAEIKV